MSGKTNPPVREDPDDASGLGAHAGPVSPVASGNAPMTRRARLGALAPIFFFDVAGPLAVYYAARAAGLSTVVALVLSGALPAFRVVATVLRHRRLDVIGALVLSAVALGTVAGLASGNARLYLLDGIVPTVVLGVVCLVSLLSARPMMFRIALETMGEDTAKGWAFADMWRFPPFRQTLRVITMVWGFVFLIESVVQAVIVETSSINTAKNTSNLLPVAVLVLTFAWTRSYGTRAQRRGAQPSSGEADNTRASFETG